MKRLALGLAVALAVLAADQATKQAALDHFTAGVPWVEVGPYLYLVLIWNTGVSFGMMQTDFPWMRWLLAGLNLAVAAGLTWWLRKAESGLAAVALGGVIGGAIGNAIDRARLGAVVDFLYFHIGQHYWPAFNVADAAIVGGVGLLLWESLFPLRGKPTS